MAIEIKQFCRKVFDEKTYIRPNTLVTCNPEGVQVRVNLDLDYSTVAQLAGLPLHCSTLECPHVVYGARKGFPCSLFPQSLIFSRPQPNILWLHGLAQCCTWSLDPSSCCFSLPRQFSGTECHIFLQQTVHRGECEEGTEFFTVSREKLF